MQYNRGFPSDVRRPPIMSSHVPRTATHVRSVSSVTSPDATVVSHRRSGSAVGTGTQFGVFDPQGVVRPGTLSVPRHVRSGSSPVSPQGTNPPTLSPYRSRSSGVSPATNSNGIGVSYMAPRSQTVTGSDSVRSPTTQRSLSSSQRYPTAKSGYL